MITITLPIWLTVLVGFVFFVSVIDAVMKLYIKYLQYRINRLENTTRPHADKECSDKE